MTTVIALIVLLFVVVVGMPIFFILLERAQNRPPKVTFTECRVCAQKYYVDDCTEPECVFCRHGIHGPGPKSPYRCASKS